jgi:tRNA(fMet)-specific endonuclease VapC
MSKYLLDTNICVHFLRGKYNFDKKFREIGIENCFISEITIIELAYGVENSDIAFKLKQIESFEKLKLLFAGRILPIISCTALYAQNRVRLRKLGKSISDFDLLIGCTSLSFGLIMVSENVSEFERIEDIQLENWVVR